MVLRKGARTLGANDEGNALLRSSVFLVNASRRNRIYIPGADVSSADERAADPLQFGRKAISSPGARRRRVGPLGARTEDQHRVRLGCRRG